MFFPAPARLLAPGHKRHPQAPPWPDIQGRVLAKDRHKFLWALQLSYSAVRGPSGKNAHIWQARHFPYCAVFAPRLGSPTKAWG